MPGDLLSALCLVAVLEGLFLFVSPGAWRRTAEQLYGLGARKLRLVGAVMLGAGLLALWIVRHLA